MGADGGGCIFDVKCHFCDWFLMGIKGRGLSRRCGMGGVACS